MKLVRKKITLLGMIVLISINCLTLFHESAIASDGVGEGGDCADQIGTIFPVNDPEVDHVGCKIWESFSLLQYDQARDFITCDPLPTCNIDQDEMCCFLFEKVFDNEQN